MADFSVVGSSLSDYYRMIQAQVHELTAPLSSEQLWVRPYPYGNSIGNLILHLTGNLSYYIGAQIGGRATSGTATWNSAAPANPKTNC